MEQYLLPLPPIFQQEMDFENNQHQNNEENEEDYYYEEGDLFEWPSQFCADPLWVNKIININFVHLKDWCPSICRRQFPSHFECLFPTFHFGPIGPILFASLFAHPFDQFVQCQKGTKWKMCSFAIWNVGMESICSFNPFKFKLIPSIHSFEGHHNCPFLPQIVALVNSLLWMDLAWPKCSFDWIALSSHPNGRIGPLPLSHKLLQIYSFY